jgi:hypothetical protein
LQQADGVPAPAKPYKLYRWEQEFKDNWLDIRTYKNVWTEPLPELGSPGKRERQSYIEIKNKATGLQITKVFLGEDLNREISRIYKQYEKQLGPFWSRGLQLPARANFQELAHSVIDQLYKEARNRGEIEALITPDLSEVPPADRILTRFHLEAQQFARNLGYDYEIPQKSALQEIFGPGGVAEDFLAAFGALRGLRSQRNGAQPALRRNRAPLPQRVPPPTTVPGLTNARVAHLNRAGYQNYRLETNVGTAQNPVWRTYYHGYIRPGETQAAIRGRHAGNVGPDGLARFNPATDRLVMEPGTRSYGEARLMEHRGIVRDQTNIGRIDVSGSRRGNNQNGLQPAALQEYEAWERALLGQ